MTKLLKKELFLTASPLSFWFILFAFLTFVPGYPILVGSFFACLGLFQTFQAAREANDITYTALLPVAKADVVRAKYIFCIFIELCYFVLATAGALLRMTVLRDAAVYRNNALMNANLSYLGYILLIFGLFNTIFIGGFFRTAYKFGKPFIRFIVAAFCVVGIGEALYHFPHMEVINSFGFENIGAQLGILVSSGVISVAMTSLSAKHAMRNFEKIDL